ncbi:hypothetical protein NTE_00047 [Candidatus Nitrososphaera evergladensis SR1]|jgi:hypothetical protein|uniref:Uncharacterized protein n=1 Tax=Candidatus Nitrososphaera evergladensis SR1 TaxID=1459636 RepID=A0A075ML20_9ARCH|nr:hypothetical protein NTE_00047 [Candidatus Nitrososphaera evergladensis SR1]
MHMRYMQDFFAETIKPRLMALPAGHFFVGRGMRGKGRRVGVAAIQPQRPCYTAADNKKLPNIEYRQAIGAR